MFTRVFQKCTFSKKKNKCTVDDLRTGLMHREPISSNLVSATSDPFWFSHFSAVSSSLFQGFKSLQLRLIGPGLVGFGLLLTVVCLLLSPIENYDGGVGECWSILWSMTIHQVRVLLCTLPPYINGCRWPIVPLFRCSLLIAKSNDISRSEISRESYALKEIFAKSDEDISGSEIVMLGL